MALIKCYECGREISDKASACPNCGAPVIENNSLNRLQQTPEETKRQNQNVSTWGIGSVVLGGASLIMPYFASVFLVPIAFVLGLISYRKNAQKLGSVGMIISFLGLCSIIYVSMQMNEIIKNPFGNLGIEPSKSSETLLVTMDKYKNIKVGMNYFDVTSLLGKNGEKLSESLITGFSTTLYSWINSDGSNIILMFQNGNLIYKAQLGLNPKESSINDSEIMKMAKQGSVEAQLIIAWEYTLGTFVPEDYYEAAKWFHMAAQKGYVEAQLQIGQLYQKGIGVEQDNFKAASWLRLAAEQGCADAQLKLANLYHRERVVTDDPVRGGEWMRRAAEQGNKVAQYNLAMMYKLGSDGFSRNYKASYIWYSLAAKDTYGVLNKNATVRRDNVAKVLTDEQIKEAQKIVSEWKPKNHIIK